MALRLLVDYGGDVSKVDKIIQKKRAENQWRQGPELPDDETEDMFWVEDSTKTVNKDATRKSREMSLSSELKQHEATSIMNGPDSFMNPGRGGPAVPGLRAHSGRGGGRFEPPIEHASPKAAPKASSAKKALKPKKAEPETNSEKARFGLRCPPAPGALHRGPSEGPSRAQARPNCASALHPR